MTATLAETVARLGGTSGLPDIRVGPLAVPSLREVLDGGGIGEWVAGVLARDAGGEPSVAGAFTAIYLIDGIVLPLAASVLRHRRAWRLELDTVAVSKRPPSGAIGTLHLADGPVLDGDDDELALHGAVATDIATTMAPLLVAVHAAAPYGLRGLWGHLADDVLSFAMTDARRRGADPDAAWADATALVEAIAAEVPDLRNRPTRQRVGADDLVVRGTCCLLYKIAGPDSWCTSCPLRPAEERASRFAAWLATQSR